MAKSILRIAGVLPWLALLAATAAAETYYGLNLQPAIYTERPVLNDRAKAQVLSEGQEYLRTYLRENLRRFLADSGAAVDWEQAQAAVSLDMTRFYTNPGDASVRTRLRVLANENMQDYFSGRRFSPGKFEMDSDLQLHPDFRLHARVDAPIDDLYEMEVGSQIRWSDNLDSRLSYTLRNSDRLYAGVALGVDFRWNDWHLEMGANYTPDAVLLQSVSFRKNF
jgi:hypothetical protein